MSTTPYTAVAIAAARKAGEILLQGLSTTFSVKEKTSPYDVVTDCDHAAEQAIISFVKSVYPHHSFLAEESGSTTSLQESICWVIDPLDGTLNFAHRLPIFCVSIAVMVDGIPEVGVIYQPVLDELFVAERGNGAFLNGKRLFVSEVSDIKHAFVTTGYPYELTLSAPYLGIPNRIIGSAALALAYVAAGRFDGYFGTNLKPWDIAAGILIVREAGGVVVDLKGAPHTILNGCDVIASNPHVAKQLLSKFTSNQP